MRFAVSLLVVALGGSIASADDAKPAPAPAPAAAPAAKRVPLRVVRVMPESHQALLFDRDRGTHVLAEVGMAIDGYQVDEIADDTVTLSANGTQVVLAAPERTWRRHDDAPAPADAKPAIRTVSAPAPADPYGEAPAPADPYGEPKPTTNAPGPSDPYGEPAVRVVEAPQPAGTDVAVRVVDAQQPPAPAPAPTVTTPAVRVVEAPQTPAPAPTVPAPAPPTPTTVVDLVGDPAPLNLTKSELSAALSDFSKLSAGIHAGFTPNGVRVDTVAAGSLFARAGLRAGDLITAVDGQPLHSLDDAADLYARASSARNISISLLRNGKPASLHVTIK